MTRMTRLSVLGLVLVSAAVVGRATAADTFSACSRNSKNKLRPSSIVVNATPICRSTETLRSWNEVGPQGPPGPSDAFSTFADPTPIPKGGVFLSLAELSLEAGNYVVTAKASLSNSNPAITAIPYCAIIRGPGFPGLNDQTIATIDGVGTVALSALLPVMLPTPNVVRFQCTNNTGAGSDGDVEAQMVTMVAIRVGTLTSQASPSGAFVD